MTAHHRRDPDALGKAQRAYDYMLPDPELPDPPALTDAAPCPCGGHAVDAPALGRWDTSAIVCSRRPACPRLASYTGRNVPTGVIDWNEAINEKL